MQQKDKRYDLIDLILFTLLDLEKRLDDVTQRLEILYEDWLEGHHNP